MTNLRRRSWRCVAGAILWALCFQYFIAEQVARAAWTIPYSLRRNYISDLGAVHCVPGSSHPVCSPLHAFMNSSFVLQGVLILAGAWLLRRSFPSGVITSIAMILIGVSGAGVFLVGLAPEDVNRGLHYAAAAEHFLCDNAGMALLGIVLVRAQAGRIFGVFTLASGLLGLMATALLPSGNFLGLGVGGMERLASYPFTVWLTVTGLLLLLRRRPGLVPSCFQGHAV